MKTILRRALPLLAMIWVPFGCYVQAGSAVPVAEGEVVVADPPPPPPPVVEPVPPPPAVGVVWVAGYHRWDGRAYVWERGRYERPPHGRAHFVPGHWEARHHGHVWIHGHWS
jgi:hypothetical protein